MVFFQTSALAALHSGLLVGWGNDYWGQRIIPDGLTNVILVAVGKDDEAPWGLAIRQDQTAVGWGAGQINSGEWPDFGQAMLPAGLDNVIALCAGASHCIALQNNGTAVVWGSNFDGQTNAIGLTNLVAVAAGDFHSLGLRADGQVIAWGANSSGETDVPLGLSNVVAISAGNASSLALKNDGTIIGWGGASSGELSFIPGLSNVVSIASGSTHSLALKSDGTVVGCGNDFYGQATPPDDLSNVIAIAAGIFHSLALRSDGTVIRWGRAGRGYPAAELDSSLVAIVAGGLSSAAIRLDFKIHALKQVGANPRVLFHTFSGQNYFVEATTNLSLENWTPVGGGNVIGNGHDVVVIDTNILASPDQRFYRVRQFP